MSDEAEDLRHNVPFKMPVVKEPPREPATPRPIDTVREQRENDRRDEVVKDRRAKALELAVLRANVQQGTPPAEVFAVANEFLRYIETGEPTA
jgi:hypothetical protein